MLHLHNGRKRNAAMQKMHVAWSGQAPAVCGGFVADCVPLGSFVAGLEVWSARLCLCGISRETDFLAASGTA